METTNEVKEGTIPGRDHTSTQSTAMSYRLHGGVFNDGDLQSINLQAGCNGDTNGEEEGPSRGRRPGAAVNDLGVVRRGNANTAAQRLEADDVVIVILDSIGADSLGLVRVVEDALEARGVVVDPGANAVFEARLGSIVEAARVRAEVVGAAVHGAEEGEAGPNPRRPEVGKIAYRTSSREAVDHFD